MDSGQRRRQTARTARLGFLLIANVAAVLILVQSLTGGSRAGLEAGSAHHRRPTGTEEPRGLGLPAKSSPTVTSPARGGDAVLERRIEGHIAAALEQAAKRSKGKVTGANTVIAVHVLDPMRGGALVSRQAGIALRPASNMKLVTSAAALVALGAQWNFETVFDSSAPIVDGVLEGDLCVRAGGDPLFDADANGQVAQLLEPAVRALLAGGVRVIAGSLILDEGSYLEPGPGPGWPSAGQHWQEHCALSAGFSANAGCLTALVQSSGRGNTARSELWPRWNGLERVGSVKTVDAGGALNIAVGATAGRATLRGEIPSSVPQWTSRFAHPDPVALFQSALVGALREAGIELRGGATRRRRVPRGTTLALLRTPLESVLAPINRDSNNAVADQLFFALGDAVHGLGTRQGGGRAVAGALEQLGVSGDGLVQVDGSGLSRDDRVTAEQLSSLLAAVLSLDPHSRDSFIASLAVAGHSGSLESRMKDEPALGRVFAKTGWIEGTGALSGYVKTLAGEPLCFSILIEYPKVSGLNKYCWKPMQDAICADLVRWKRSSERVR